MQAHVGSHCVDCARESRPSATFKAKAWNARQITLVTYALIAVNTGVLIWMGVDDPASLGLRNRISGVQFDLGLARGLLTEDEWYRLVSAGFLHFGIVHFAFNMLLLFQLGQLLEPAIGRVRFGLMYGAALLGGSAGAVLLEPRGLHGGASGAVFGLMAAAAVGLRYRGINPFATSIGPLLLINLLLTFSIPGISIGGHLGGVVAGGVAALVIMAPPWKFPKWLPYATPVAVALLSVGVAVVASRM
ncbi:MAG: rhomboid family intramembrane serine protease [Actinomycetota bacterium]|nr:rhomboid family intramembrane serine protease [Actinomycetota bacterium]